MKKIQFDNQSNVIAEQVKFFRTKNKLTQRELAAKMQTFGVNLDQQMISKIENNTRIVTDYELAFLCIALRVNITDMLANFYNDYGK